MDGTRRRVLWHGMLLFLIGLVTGLAEPRFANARMGLAAHLEGVMNGTFLLALGAIWPEVRLTALLEAIALRSVLYGTYANWAMTTLAAVWGTAAMNPITSAGHGAAPWQEILATCGFTSVGIAMLAASALILYGLRRQQAALKASASDVDHS